MSPAAGHRPSEMPPLRIGRWLSTFAVDLAVLMACFWAWIQIWRWDSWMSGPVLFALLVVIGSRQHALAILGHDGSHRAISRNRKLNDALATLCLSLIGGALHPYRSFHAQHHAHTGVPGKDKELLHIHHPLLGAPWRLPMTRTRFWGFLSLNFVGGALPHLMYLMRLSGPRNVREALPIVAFVLTLCGLSVAMGVAWVPLVWFGALWTTFWAFFHIRIFTEHVGAAESDGYTHAVAFPLWMKLLTHPHNVWLHEVHHQYPAVPFYDLPKYARRDTTVPVGQLYQRLVTPA